MRLIRTPGFMLAISLTLVLLLYFGLVADRAFLLLQTGEAVGRGLGIALVILPAIGVWYLIHEWHMGSTVQKMANVLEDEGRLPIHDGATLPSGRLTDDAAEAVFEVARRAVDDRPDDWRAWFHVAYAYEAARDRPLARKALRHAADLFRRDRSRR